MRIFRGPKSKDFTDDSHELVDSQDLTQDSWTETKTVEVNITKREDPDRQSVVNIVFDADDIIALYQGLIQGWQEELQKSRQDLTYLQSQTGVHRKALWDIRGITNNPFEIIFGKVSSDVAVEKIEKIVNSALNLEQKPEQE